jgi:hypothetical protein
MTSMTSVGYGDIIAVDTPERVYALIVMLLGGFFYGYMISTMAHLVSTHGGICTLSTKPFAANLTFGSLPSDRTACTAVGYTVSEWSQRTVYRTQSNRHCNRRCSDSTTLNNIRRLAQLSLVQPNSPCGDVDIL